MGTAVYPVAKFAVCKAGMPFVAEAMEVLGGIGYCEESELPRLYREMPVNSIWEGSGNIMCLDVLRVLAKQQGISELLHDAFGAVKGQDRHFDRAWRQLQQQLRKPLEAQGREITRQLYLLATGRNYCSSLPVNSTSTVPDDVGYTRRVCCG